jgi:hypothetical protein
MGGMEGFPEQPSETPPVPERRNTEPGLTPQQRRLAGQS